MKIHWTYELAVYILNNDCVDEWRVEVWHAIKDDNYQDVPFEYFFDLLRGEQPIGIDTRLFGIKLLKAINKVVQRYG